MTDTPTLGCRSLFINTTAHYKQLPTPQPKSPFYPVLRQFRGKVLPIILLKIRMLCHPERSEGSRAGKENYTARDFARFFANAQNDTIL